MSQQKYNKTVQVQVTIIPRQPGKELSVLPGGAGISAWVRLTINQIIVFFVFFYDFFFFIRMVPVSKYIKGTTLVRNTYLPISSMKDSQGLLQRIEEENNDNANADFQSLKSKVETLRMDHDSYLTTEEREKNNIHQKIKTLEVKRDFILL